MMRVTLRALGLSGAMLAVLVLWAEPARAQVRAPNFGIGAHATVFNANDADDPVVYGGGHIRLRPLGFLGLEGLVDYRREEFATGRVTVERIPILASVLLYPFSIGPLEPYLLGGVGWYFNRIDVEDNGSEDSDRVGGHAGVGLDLAISPQFVLHGDIRYVFTELDTTLTDDLDVDGWMATLGVTFYFR